ncbi:MAG TPA: ABC transporter permease [Firmicutes bacterium]|nr:ABC transporter permease [Bacillota bacterium]
MSTVTPTKRKRKKSFEGNYIILKIVVFLLLIYLLLPIIIVVISSFAQEEYLTLTPSAFSLRWYENFFSNTGLRNSFRNSLVLALASTFFALVIGTLSAYAMDKSKWRRFFISFFGSPLLIPAIIIGIAMMQMANLLGLPRSMPILIVAHTLVGIPYVVRTVTASLYRFNAFWEEASFTMGAGRFKTIWYVTLPILKPGLIASGCFAFITSFGNMTISTFLTTSRFMTLPIQLFAYAKNYVDPTIAAVSATTLLLTTVILLVVDRLVGIDKMY